jgi:hypothetical protein
MSNTVNISIPLAPNAAKALSSGARRQAAGRVLSDLLAGKRAGDLLADALTDLKQEARANGLNDSDIDAELRAWHSE